MGPSPRKLGQLWEIPFSLSFQSYSLNKLLLLGWVLMLTMELHDDRLGGVFCCSPTLGQCLAQSWHSTGI